MDRGTYGLQSRGLQSQIWLSACACMLTHTHTYTHIHTHTHTHTHTHKMKSHTLFTCYISLVFFNLEQFASHFVIHDIYIRGVQTRCFSEFLDVNQSYFPPMIRFSQYLLVGRQYKCCFSFHAYRVSDNGSISHSCWC